ncbi:antitoxin (DNA-binding transcriptional repressor) of toxin-antitoxin stability system [Oxalobacteraceae bacterium GrIS 2.11]
MQTISATDLARNTRQILDRVVSQGESIAVERNNTMVAKIVPPETTMTAVQALSGLTLPILTLAQAKSWLKDSRGEFDQTVRNPWE